ncbi:MAG: copper resistance protein CopC, partial [Chloroflexota bacterium]
MAGRNRDPRSLSARLLPATLLAVLLFLFAAPRSAWAHAVPVHAGITPGTLIPTLPPTLTLDFSENLAGTSNLAVIGPSGLSAVSGSPAIVAGGRGLRARLVFQGGGTYRVYWNSISAEDGQAMAGAFSFAVGYTTSAGDLARVLTPHGSGTLAVTGFIGVLIQWLLLLTAIAWAGIALLEMPSGVFASQGTVTGAEAWVVTFIPQARGVRLRLLEVLLGLLVFGWILEAARIASAGREGIFGALAALFAGHLGFYRVILFILPLWALLGQRAEMPPPPPPPVARGATPAVARTGAPPAAPPTAPSRLPAALPSLPVPPLGRWGRLVAAAIFLLALSAGSHAAGIPDLTLSAVLLDWLHLLASVAWIGGMAYFVTIALPVLENMDLDKRAPLTLGLLRRYGAFTGAAIVVLCITGLFAAQAHVGSWDRLFGSSYGRRLDLKLLLTLILAVQTGYLLIVQRAHAERTWNGRRRLESLGVLDRMGNNLRVGLAVGAVLLLATAALSSNAPASVVPLAGAGSRLTAIPGGSWQAVGLRGQVVNRLLFAPNSRHILWAATNHGVWLSTDDQKTWHRRGAALAKLSILDLMAIDNGGTLLAAGANGQIYRTKDMGLHWRLMGRPFGTHPLRSLAMHGKVLLAAGDDGIFRSIDDSNHWKRTLKDSVATVYWSDAANQFLAGVEVGPWQIYGGGTGGSIWRILPNAPNVQAGVPVLASTAGATPRYLAASSASGLWIAPTPGGVWSPASG